MKALNRDLLEMDKQLKHMVRKADVEMRLGVAEAKAQTDSVRALFTGYALAARQQAASGQKIMETIRGVMKDSREKTEAIIKAEPRKPASPPLIRSFKKPKSWETIQRQTK